MPLFSSNLPLVGIEPSDEGLKMTVLRASRSGWKVEEQCEINSFEDVNPFYKYLREGMTVSGLCAHEVLVRPLEIQLKKQKDIRSALAFQAESLLPYPVEKSILEAEMIDQQSFGTLLTLLSVRKDHLSDHLEKLQEFSIEPEVVSTVPLALAALSTLASKAKQPILVIHRGRKEVSCALVEEGKLLAARAFEVKKDFQSELHKTILALTQANRAKPFEEVISLEMDPLIVDLIEEVTKKKAILPSSFSLSLSQEEWEKYAISVGLALHGSMRSAVNFRRQEFAYPYPFKRVKKPAITFLLCASLLFAALFSLSQVALHKKESAVKHQYISFVSSVRDEKTMTIPKNPKEYLLKIRKIEKTINARPDTFPLLPQVPMVKDLLGWLSNHPEAKNCISIKSLNYSMLKRPDLQRKKEKYCVKVDLEFEAQNPSAARAFHDALLTTNPFVDPKHEVLWSTQKERYRTSFYLKDKTRYS